MSSRSLWEADPKPQIINFEEDKKDHNWNMKHVPFLNVATNFFHYNGRNEILFPLNLGFYTLNLVILFIVHPDYYDGPYFSW